MSSTVAVIVPLLNEIKALPTLLVALCRLGAQELIIVDGGSTDGSREWLSENQCGDFIVVDSVAGRAQQMNAGAETAKSDILLFLHADTALPDLALEEVKLGKWGRFDVAFHDNRDPELRLLNLVETMINLRSRITGIATGDQAMFVERSLFEKVGGFPSMPLMEDIELSKRLRKIAKPSCSYLKVKTSARRWRQHGVVKTILLMWWLRLAYFAGVSPQRLQKIYRQAR